MAKPILISGIQPTGRLHLGNYLGALKNFVDLQNSGKYQCRFFVADLHALTENPNAKDLNKNIVSLAADFLAAGLDPKKSIIFQQSQIGPVQELKWILSPLTPTSELIRMTAFKEKVLQALKPEEREKITKEKFKRKKKPAVTDSGSEIKYDEKEKPGISNLLSIMAGLSGKPIATLEKEFANANYGKFKQSLAVLVSDYFASFRKKKAALLKNPTTLKKVLQSGAVLAQKSAAKKRAEIKKKIGLII